jgi:hypothetical protein
MLCAGAGLRLDRRSPCFAGLYHIIEITPTLVAQAMILAETYALRGYDAVQLAVAVEVNARGISLGLPVLTLILPMGSST